MQVLMVLALSTQTNTSIHMCTLLNYIINMLEKQQTFALTQHFCCCSYPQTEYSFSTFMRFHGSATLMFT